ncbi:MAG TPA: hypothetical protein VMR96_10155 [Solirubrobacterales bacterium]|nr:hypothetical protein [Solirubrobacterales bacterium]
MIRRAGACLAIAAIGILALPSGAAGNVLDIPTVVPAQFRAQVRARLQMSPPRHGFESHLELEARNGYEISVIGEGGVVAVEVSKPAPDGKESALERLFGIRRAVTAYVARGIVTARRIAASFGKFGELDLRFRPSGRVVKSPSRKRCRGADHFTGQLGVFVGGFRFSGEKNYVAVRSHRVKGRVRSPLRLHCASSRFRFRPAASPRARPVPQLPSFFPTFLGASNRHGVSATELIAIAGRKATLFLAVTEEGLGSMARIRYALATERSKRAIALNDALTSASIEPPPPFHGKGTYRAFPDGTTSWLGPLSVALPGAPRLPLTGEEFETILEASF